MTWFLAALGAAGLLILADRPIAPREHRSVAAFPIPRVPPDRLARPAVIAVAAAVALLWHPLTGLLVRGTCAVAVFSGTLAVTGFFRPREILSIRAYDLGHYRRFEG